MLNVVPMVANTEVLRAFMPFYFTCPHCLHKTLVSEQLSGQSGPCVGCGKPVTVPQPPAARRTDIAPAQERTEANIVQLKTSRKIPRWAVRSVLYSAVAVPFVILIFWMASPALLKLRTQRNITLCKQNLQRIAKALNAYAADYGTYPPSTTYDAAGKPMHSWRVLILPYLGERKLYEKYDLTKAWDSVENVQLQARIPSVYVSPANTNVAVGESSYMLITGPKTLFPRGAPLSPSQIQDGANNTLLVVETNNRLGAWTQPIDLDLSTLPPSVGAVGGIGGSHPTGATAVLADGEPVFLPVDASKNLVDGLITPNGGESVEGRWYK